MSCNFVDTYRAEVVALAQLSEKATARELVQETLAEVEDFADTSLLGMSYKPFLCKK